MTMTTQTEIERKYDVDEKAAVPDLSEIARVEQAGEAELEAQYFDTERGDLAAHRVVLRRRRGGSDEGWHIKVPAAEGRTELHWPITDADAPPSEVVDRVRSRARGRELGVIATLRTHRTLTHLFTDAGEPLLELADDTVSATDAATGVLRLWREWEVELLAGGPPPPRGASRSSHRLSDEPSSTADGPRAGPSSSTSRLLPRPCCSRPSRD
jgi:hypothetical protein